MQNEKNSKIRNYQIKRFEELEIYDSFMFGKVMQNEKLCKRFLECVLEMQIAKIAFIQREYQEGISSNYRNIRLDIRVEDTKGTIHDIEMQADAEKQRADNAEERADQAQQQADVEKERADQAQQQAAAEKERANHAEERVNQAELELQKLREQLKELSQQREK